MKQAKRTSEYASFARALGKVLTVSHSELKAKLEAERAAKKPSARRASSSARVSGGKG